MKDKDLRMILECLEQVKMFNKKSDFANMQNCLINLFVFIKKDNENKKFFHYVILQDLKLLIKTITKIIKLDEPLDKKLITEKIEKFLGKIKKEVDFESKLRSWENEYNVL